MDISVVIPMYNSEDTIIKSLDSIKNQTAFKYILEIIVVNDGSTDRSLEIVEEYSNENSDLNIIIIDKTNGGVSSARNRGIEEAKGEWIALLDSDDEWLKDKIERQVKCIQNNKEIDFIGGNINNEKLKIFGKEINNLYKANIKDLCVKMFPQTSTAIFKRSIFEQIGGYDETQSYAEDGNYFLKICANYNYYHLPVNMVSYGNGKAGFGISGLSANLKKMHEGNIKNIKELRKNKDIGILYYIFIYLFYNVKYIRRILIIKRCK